MAGCGGESRTYSVEETEAAFAAHGFDLEVPSQFVESVDPEGAVMAQPGDDRFYVVVTTDDEADDVWPDFERMQDANSFDARRANVAVFSDDGMPERDRGRVLAALESLPDRGDAVMIAGR